MIRALVVVVLLVGCGGSATTTPEPTERPPTLEEEIAQYVQTWGGSEGQYRIILTLEECENLARLGDSALISMENEPEGSPEWRADLGYANAVNHRQLQLDC